MIIKSIRNYEDFKSRIPVQTYEEIKPYVERLRAGEQNLLWPSEIRWFAKSSGTTNDKSKFLPVSKEALARHSLPRRKRCSRPSTSG